MKKSVIIEIFETKISFINFQFIQTVEMNIDRAQTVQNFFFAQNDDCNEKKNIFVSKKSKKKLFVRKN